MLESGKYPRNKNIFKKSGFLFSSQRLNNPFEKDCQTCIANIWEKIVKKADELEEKCYPNTYVWIEKFKDDNC